jgi:hypothetical protein
LPKGTFFASGVPSKRVQESRLSNSTASKPLAAHCSIIGATQRAAFARLRFERMSTRYSPPHFGSSPSFLRTSLRGQLSCSSGRSVPDSFACVWNAFT